METIQDNGVTFVKATALAKKYRYTTDYIGQLCRSGKVDAKLIGRAWFVNEDSLMGHKNDRYSGVRQSEITINKSLVSDRESHPVALRREVRPVLSKSAHRSILQHAEPKTFNFESRSSARVSTYHQDEAELEPEFSPMESSPKHAIRDDSDEKAFKINVSLEEKSTRKLAFEELPEIALRGDLTIDSLDDPDFFAEVEPVRSEQIQFTPQSVLKTAVIVEKRPQPRVSVSSMRQVQPVAELNVEEEFDTPGNRGSVSVRTAKRASQPETVRQGVRFIVVPVFVSTAVVLSALLLGLVSHAESDGLQFRESVKFTMAAVIESVSKITESY